MIEKTDYNCDFENKWCPGCGNFGILDSMQQALAELDIAPEKVLIVSGIGQAAKTPHFLRCNFFHGLHGRALPVATGAKTANRDLNILVNMGDGDCYGEGGNHFLSAVRRNLDVTLLVHNNRVYGLTKGQASPTSERGFVTGLQPHGARSDPMNPLALALSQGAGFAARSYCADKEQLSRLIRQGMEYRGFALIDILQVCVSFNRINTYEWYRERVYDANRDGHDETDLGAALDLSFKDSGKIPTGLFYRKQTVPFSDRLGISDSGSLISIKRDPAQVQAVIDNA